MEHVYTAHFGLTEPPFNITPDPDFFYRSVSHREALAQLAYGINARKGFVVLTGEVGTGKTTLIHSLLRELGANCHTALIFSAVSSPSDLLRWICEEFHLIEPREACAEHHDYLNLLNDFLLQRYRNNENCALIIDEAQNLSPEVLESIRLLSNFETSKHKLLQIILVGQPELSLRLNARELRQLKQRIALRHELRPLNSRECQEYVCTRMRIAGGKLAVFTPQALEAIYRCSGGIPRLINVLGDNALLTAYAMEKKQIDQWIIEEVSRDLSICKEQEVPITNIGSYRSHRNGAAHDSGASLALSSCGYQSPEGAKFVTVQRLNVLRSGLIDAMGPMAAIVLDECIRTLGYTLSTFPEKKWDTLIDSLSEEILDFSMRRKFQDSYR